jgi:AraC-like DNA-binding protein/tetratricopeptide (TPR) repeat protein
MIKFLVLYTFLVFLFFPYSGYTYNKTNAQLNDSIVNAIDSLLDENYQKAGIIIGEILKDTSALNKTNYAPRVYYMYGKYLFRSNNTDSMEYYYRKSIEFADKWNDDYIKERAYFRLAGNLFHIDIVRSIQIYEEIVALGNQLDDNPLRVKGNIGIANAYSKLSYKNKAMHYYLEAKKLCDSTQTLNLITLNYNIGLLYQELGEYKDAIAYFDKVIVSSLKVDDFYALGSVYNALGELHAKKGEYDIAIQNLNESIRIGDEIGASRLIYYSLVILSDINTKKKHFNKALDNLYEAERIAKRDNNNYFLGHINYHLAEVYLDMQLKNKAQFHIKKALEYFEKSPDLELQKKLHYLLYSLHKENNKIDIALKEFIRYSTIKDSLVQKNNLLEIGRLESKNKIDQFKKDNELLTREKEFAEKEVHLEKSRKNLLFLIVIILAISISALLLLIFKIKSKNKDLHLQQLLIEEKNKNLAMQNEEIQMQQEELLATNDELIDNINRYEEAVKNKEWLIKVIAEYISKPFRNIKKSISSIQSKKSITEQYNAIQEIQNEINTSENVLLNLFDEKYLYKKAFSFKAKEIDLIESLNSFTSKFDLINIRLNTNIKSAEITMDEDLFQKSILQLITILMHSGVEEINLELKQKESIYNLLLEGKGQNIKQIVNSDLHKDFDFSNNLKITEDNKLQVSLSFVYSMFETLNIDVKPAQNQDLIEFALEISDNADIQKIDLENKKLIPDEEAQRIFNLIDEKFNSQKLYQDSDLSLNKLAENIDIHYKQISYAINKIYGNNFISYLNDYRINEAKKLLKDPAYNHFSYLAIGYEAGFNSKSTFYSAFKKATGVSPKEFKATA